MISVCQARFFLHLGWAKWCGVCFLSCTLLQALPLKEKELPATTSSPACHIRCREHQDSCYQVGSQGVFCFRPSAWISRAAAKVRNQPSPTCKMPTVWLRRVCSFQSCGFLIVFSCFQWRGGGWQGKRKRTMNHCTVNQNEDFSFLRKGTSGYMICA